jgi:hypothetical protein
MLYFWSWMVMNFGMACSLSQCFPGLSLEFSCLFFQPFVKLNWTFNGNMTSLLVVLWMVFMTIGTRELRFLLLWNPIIVLLWVAPTLFLGLLL